MDHRRQTNQPPRLPGAFFWSWFCSPIYLHSIWIVWMCMRSYQRVPCCIISSYNVVSTCVCCVWTICVDRRLTVHVAVHFVITHSQIARAHTPFISPYAVACERSKILGVVCFVCSLPLYCLFYEIIALAIAAYGRSAKGTKIMV